MTGQPRIDREGKTIGVMIEMYCHHHHNTGKSLCEDCRRLFDYALERLEKCPFQQAKPTCAHCAVHCYNPAMRENVQAVMRYSGPRMAWRHPIMALLHIRDKRRQPTENHSKGARK